jgi:flavin reductase (DIM6/NTAB) family NADH-FMN oxidoreductase RutF
MKTSPLNAQQFRKALGHFATGVTVVTVERAPGAVRGMTANSFSSVSLDPLLILICVDKRAAILPMLEKKKQFGVSALKEGHEAISEYFAKGAQTAEAEQRLSIHYRWTPSGIPVLEGTLLQLSCEVVATHPAGDHTIFVGQVVEAEIHEGKPLRYFVGE